MEVLGYTVSDIRLVVDGKGEMVEAERPCDICLGSEAKVIKTSLDGWPEPWRESLICPKCLVRGGWYLSLADLREELTEMCGGRGRG